MGRLIRAVHIERQVTGSIEIQYPNADATQSFGTCLGTRNGTIQFALDPNQRINKKIGCRPRPYTYNITGTDKFDSRFGAVMKRSRRQMFWPIGLAVGVVIYLAYAWVAFDMTTLIQQSRMDRGMILALDSFAYKVHVTEDLRDEEGPEVSIEGARQGGFKQDPDWVQRRDAETRVDLGDGYAVTLQARSLVLTAPGLDRPIEARVLEDGTVEMTGPQPDWVKFNDRRFEARPSLFQRVRMTRTRIEVHRYFLGWENFWFGYDSPFHGMGLLQAWDYAANQPQIEEGLSNTEKLLSDIWTNKEWQHGEVFKALLETILMALLGTMVASMVGLPLAFAAARNFNPVTPLRLAIRRVFDFLRGIDMLIWSLIFIRAFGLGPLTGIMAIAFTDTGTLGKLYSEAVENIDEILTVLEGQGVQIVDEADLPDLAPDATAGSAKTVAEKEPVKKKPEVAKAGKPTVTERIDDPVRMYLTQMGEIPLLTRKEEISLARQIEVTRAHFRRLIMATGFAIKEGLQIIEDVEAGRLAFDRTLKVSTSGFEAGKQEVSARLESFSGRPSLAR